MRRWLSAALVAGAIGLPACATGGAAGSRDVRLGASARAGGAVVTQAELQADLERFSGELIARVTDAGEGLFQTTSPANRQRALRQVLLYASSALDIATGPRPEIALLDMVVFVHLVRSVFERYWVHELGEASQPVLTALRRSERELAEVAAKVLATKDEARLHALIDEWLEANPDRIRVEAIRFGELSQLVGQISAAAGAETSGIFGAVQSATRAADEALLMADRARFLAIRVPFLLRLHARVGVSEVASDVFAQLGGIEESLAGLEPEALVRDLTAVTTEARYATEAARAVLSQLSLLLEKHPPEEIDRLLGAALRLSDKTLPLLERVQAILTQLDALVPDDATKSLASVEQRADDLMTRAVVYLLAIGAAWSVLFWGSYCAAKTILARNRSRGRRRRPADRRGTPESPAPTLS